MTEAGRASPGRLVEEASRLLGDSLNDLVPHEAQVHLLNAQRELLLALVVTIEHHAARGRTPEPGTAPRKRGRGAGTRAKTRKPARVELE